jgi:hypothetical protein
MSVEYFGERPRLIIRKRVFRDNHTLQKESDDGGGFTIRCSCGWFTSGLVALPDGPEYAAYLHRTEPDLLVTGSSDVTWRMRQQVLAEKLRNGML